MEQSTEISEEVLLARQALHRPHSARLLVDGTVPGELTQVNGVELIDRHGTPVLVCEPDSALAAASRDRRAATLTLQGPDAQVVVMRGRLSPLCADVIEEREVELVELVLAGLRVGEQPVDLGVYLQEPAALLETYVDEVVDHSNRDHGPQLREFSALVSGVPTALIVSARLTCLDPAGVTVSWIDVEGAHEVRMLFPHRARTRRELAAHLAQALCVRQD